MKKTNIDYIPIRSKQDLESSLKGYHLGKKFIDENGNIYTVKFNRNARRLDVVRVVLRSELMGESLAETNQLRQKNSSRVFLNPQETIEGILRDYQTKQFTHKEAFSEIPYEDQFEEIDETETVDTNSDLEGVQFDNTPDPVEKEIEVLRNVVKPTFPSLAEEHIVYRDIISEIDKLNGKIKNTLDALKRGNIFILVENISENRNILANFERVFDYEVFDVTERLKRKYKELVLDPKPFYHYTGGLSDIRMKFLENTNSDDKMHYVIRWELFETLQKNVVSMRRMLFDLLSLLNSKHDLELDILNYSQMTTFQDSKKFVLFCLQCVTSLEKRLNSWKEKMIEYL
jgi:hypothetical protein